MLPHLADLEVWFTYDCWVVQSLTWKDMNDMFNILTHATILLRTGNYWVYGHRMSWMTESTEKKETNVGNPLQYPPPQHCWRLEDNLHILIVSVFIKYFTLQNTCSYIHLQHPLLLMTDQTPNNYNKKNNKGHATSGNMVGTSLRGGRVRAQKPWLVWSISLYCKFSLPHFYISP